MGFDSVCETVVQELKGVDVLEVSRGEGMAYIKVLTEKARAQL